MAVIFLFLLIFSRFFVVQIVQGEKLRYRAIGQWTREIPVVAARGTIEDRNGVVLADNSASYSVFVRPNAVKDRTETASALASLFGLDGAELAEKLETTRVSELTVARHVDKSLAEELEKYDLPGVYYARDNTRVYPYGQALSRVLGFTSTDNTGLTGLEKYYDKYLAGMDGEIAYPADLVGVEVEGEAVYLPATDGLTVRTTVDYGIQAVAEAALERVYEQYSPVSAQCIVLDPNNFDVLAMAEYPGNDLNDVPRDDPELLNDLSRNDIVSDIYEPGSTFKIVTAAANIEEHLRGNPAAFSLQYVFNSSRTRSVDGTTIKCWSNHANGKHCNQTLAEALNNSCNPCFTDIALALGTETFYDYLEAFNFGKVTGIDFSGEAQGMLVPESSVRACDLARIGFGQTVSTAAIITSPASSAASMRRTAQSRRKFRPCSKTARSARRRRASSRPCSRGWSQAAAAARRTSKDTKSAARRARRRNLKTEPSRRASMCPRFWAFSRRTIRSTSRSSSSTSRRAPTTAAWSPRPPQRKFFRASSI